MNSMHELNQRDHSYVLAVFRSRQHTLKYESILKKMGIQVEVISTPKEAAIGCGLSLRIAVRDMQKIIDLWKYSRPEALVGIYLVEPGGSKKLLKSVRVFSARY